MTLWRIGRADVKPLLLIALLPLLIAMPLLLGFLNADPVIFNGGVTIDPHRRAVDADGFPTAAVELIKQRGAPGIEGNAGITWQALGRRAALELLHGHAPWWNAYSGVGLPLAADYAPAAFFPPTLLLLLPQGMLLEHLLLQILAGWGTYALLRQLRLGQLAALTGGVLYAFNGTMAWYDCGAAFTLPFLPWMLLGIERALVKAELGLQGGWRIFAVAMALNILGGFPEAAYLNGLMALAWAVLRLCQSPAEKRLAFAWRIATGGLVALAITAPQTFAFFQSLPISFALFHGHGWQANIHEEPIHAVPSLIAPYVFGPIFKYSLAWPEILPSWSGLGGYVTAAMLVIAAYGAIARRSGLGWLLLGWTILALGKSFGIQPAVYFWNLVPGVTETAVCRYVQATWILALTILAGMGVDDLFGAGKPHPGARLAAALVALIAIGGCIIFGVHYWSNFHASPGLRAWTLGSLIWAALSALVCLALLAAPFRRWSASILAAVVMVEGIFMFAVPTLSNAPPEIKVDTAAIGFLQRNLGLSRFYTLGPIQPNYGAYYGIASINHILVPIPQLWAHWDEAHLDDAANNLTVAFRGFSHAWSGKLKPSQALSGNIPTFEWLGVKYVVTAPDEISSSDPSGQAVAVGGSGTQSPPKDSVETMRKVFTDNAMDIYELPHPSPYFEVVSGQCSVVARDRTDATVDCATPATLLRRELFYPGWNARVNGTQAAINVYKDLFQTISLPRGKSTVSFDYAPPHIIWMWLAALIGLASLFVSALLELRGGRQGMRPRPTCSTISNASTTRPAGT